MTHEEALEAAKLAAMVGGQLKYIDKHFLDRSNIPANRININNFIDQVKDPRRRTPTAAYLANTPNGFAPPPPEDFIQAQVPDIKPQQQVQPPPPIPSAVTVPSVVPSVEAQLQPPAPVHAHTPVSAHEEVYKEISDTLKSIDSTLRDMLVYMKEDHI
jgi:hypothetical protein